MAETLAMMPGVGADGTECGNHLVSCARGGVVDEVAVLDALNSGMLTSCALDVFEVEPLPEHSPLRELENVVLTPHSAPDNESFILSVRNALDNLLRISNGNEPQSIAVDHEEVTRQFLELFPEVKLTAS